MPARGRVNENYQLWRVKSIEFDLLRLKVMGYQRKIKRDKSEVKVENKMYFIK